MREFFGSVLREWPPKKPGRWSSYRRKWGRRLLNSGEGVYFLLMVVLAFTALAARGALTGFQAHHEAFRSEMGSILQGEHEPRRVRHLGVVATLLAPLAQRAAEGAHAGDLEALQGEARRLWQTHDALWRGVTGADTVEGAISKAATILTTSKDIAPERIAEWKARAATDLGRTAAAWHSPDLCNCELRACDARPNPASHGGDYGPMGCRDAGANERVILMAPSFANAASMLGSCSSGTAEPAFRCSPSVYRATLHRDILENVLSPLVADTAPASSVSAMTLAQVYVISPDDVIALSSEPVRPSTRDFPLTRRWAATHYFESFYESNGRAHDRDGYSTQPYIDYGGNGIVRTVCRPLLLQSDGRPQAELQALFCSDFAYSAAAIMDQLKGSNILSSTCVRLQIPPDLASPVSVLPQPDDCDRLTRAQREAIETQLNWSQKDRRDLFRSITPLKLDHDGKSFLVPLGPVPGHHSSIQAVVLSVSMSLPPSVWIYTFVSLGFGSFGLLALALGASHARNTADRRELGRWLKTLQVGVLIVGPDDIIEAANDRAEEIMARSLPRIALADEEKDLCTPFHECIDDGVIEWNDGHFEVKSYARDIRSRRQAGESSRYFAKLTANAEWVQITASPISSNSTQVPTYGVVESVLDSRRWHLLEVAYQLAKAGQTAVIICDRHGGVKASNASASAIVSKDLPALDIDGSGDTRKMLTQCFSVMLTEAHLICSELSVPAEGAATLTFYGLTTATPSRWVRLCVGRLRQSAWDPQCVCRAHIQLTAIDDPEQIRSLAQSVPQPRPPHGAVE